MKRVVMLVLALLVAMTGCESASSSMPPPPISYEPVGELTGTWMGTWAGSPLTLVVVKYEEAAPYSGLYFGPWLIAGVQYPGLTGVLTFASSGSPTSVRFDGWIYSSRPFTAFVQARSLDGDLYLRLLAGGTGVLIGDGYSTFGWGPKGPVELTHQ